MRRCALLRCSTHPRLLACLLHIMGSPSRLYLTPRCYGWDVCILPTGLGCFVALAPPPRTMAAGRAGLPPLPAGGHWAHHHWGICWLVSLSLPSHCLPRRDRYSSGRAGLEDMLLATPSPRCSDCPGHEGLHWSLVWLELLGLLCSTIPAMTRSLGGALRCRFRLSQAPTFCSSFEVTCYIWTSFCRVYSVEYSFACV